ncbi:hypothetical protein SUDANB178_00141 [Streptomyces sp. enrichment culture]
MLSVGGRATAHAKRPWRGLRDLVDVGGGPEAAGGVSTHRKMMKTAAGMAHDGGLDRGRPRPRAGVGVHPPHPQKRPGADEVPGQTAQGHQVGRPGARDLPAHRGALRQGTAQAAPPGPARPHGTRGREAPAAQVRARGKEKAAVTDGLVVSTRARFGFTAAPGTTDDARICGHHSGPAIRVRGPPLHRPGPRRHREPTSADRGTTATPGCTSAPTTHVRTARAWNSPTWSRSRSICRPCSRTAVRRRWARPRCRPSWGQESVDMASSSEWLGE